MSDTVEDTTSESDTEINDDIESSVDDIESSVGDIGLPVDDIEQPIDNQEAVNNHTLESLLDMITNSTNIAENEKNMLMSLILDGDISSMFDFLRNVTDTIIPHNNHQPHEKISIDELVDEQKKYNTKYCNEICNENEETTYTFGISESSKIEKCSICLEDIQINYRLIRTSCDHIFCPECFYRW